MSNKEFERVFYKMFLILIGVTASVLLLVLFSSLNQNQVRINSYQTCKDAGYPIMESYPAQCKGPNGKIYREIVPTENAEVISPTISLPISQQQNNFYNTAVTPTPLSPSPTGYYGHSTYGACSGDNDCRVAGCNTEICQSKNEQSTMSICSVPDRQTYSQAGYSCGCINKKCQWRK